MSRCRNAGDTSARLSRCSSPCMHWRLRPSTSVTTCAVERRPTGTSSSSRNAALTSSWLNSSSAGSPKPRAHNAGLRGRSSWSVRGDVGQVVEDDVDLDVEPVGDRDRHGTSSVPRDLAPRGVRVEAGLARAGRAPAPPRCSSGSRWCRRRWCRPASPTNASTGSRRLHLALVGCSPRVYGPHSIPSAPMSSTTISLTPGGRAPTGA